MEEKNRTGKNCLYCGTNMTGMCQLRTRKYCSASCGSKYRLRLKKPDVQSKLWVHAPETFENAMKMYWDGYGGADIAQRFSIPVGTAYSWIHDFGSQHERAEPMRRPAATCPAKKPWTERFKTAADAGEWLEALREDTLRADETFKGVTINLVCGYLHGYSAGKLASVVSDGLKEDPLSGKSYAFCSKCRNTITVLAWKAPVFHISRYVKMHGTFIWPGEDLGRTIEVSRAEFDRLIFLQKRGKASLKLLEEAAQINA